MKILIFLLYFGLLSFAQVSHKLYPFDGGVYHKFGHDVSLDTNYFVISAANGSLGAGAVYLYKTDRHNINFVQKILPDTSYFGYYFGNPVILYDSLLFIGASRKVHIYKKYGDSVFNKIDMLTPKDMIDAQEYGRALSMHNKCLLVGAYLHGFHTKGAAYYYEYTDSNWVLKQQIFPGFVERKAQFGFRVSLFDKYAVITAPGDGYESGPFRGAVFLFEKTDSGWIEKQKILPPDFTYYQRFGVDLALDGNRIAIGASGNVLNQNYNGRVYIYELNNAGYAELQDSIFASDNFPGNNFGWSFRLRGDSLFVGANANQYVATYSKPGFEQTWAYLYVKTENGWEEKLKFEPDVLNQYTSFGYSVDFLNGNFLVGSPGDPTIALLSGAAYLFQPNITSVKNTNELKPVLFYLSQNYPNPFNPSTVIAYQLPASLNPSSERSPSDKGGTLVTLKVYDVLGREVAILVNEYKEAGKHSVEFNAAGLPSGVYFYRLNAGSFSETKKMILLR